MSYAAPNPERIVLWRASLSTLPDHHFFDMLRMYLGEIKTPYNKQKLIEDLSAFLRKDEIKTAIVRLLSPQELDIVTTVHLLGNPTRETLCRFFSAESTYTALVETLLNLEERLVLFRYTDADSGKVLVSINPHLMPVLEPLLTKERLFPQSAPAESAAQSPTSGNASAGAVEAGTAHVGGAGATGGASGSEFSGTSLASGNASPGGLRLLPELVAAFYSFIAENPELLKNDGTFKKRAETLLAAVFPLAAEGGAAQGLETLQLLYYAFANLSLVYQTESGVALHQERWKRFAQLAQPAQYAYLVAASTGHFPRDMMQKQAQLLIDIASGLSASAGGVAPGNFTKTVLLRNAYYLQCLAEKRQGSVHSGRFAALLRRAASTSSGGSLSPKAEPLDRGGSTSSPTTGPLSGETATLIENALKFGVFVQTGTTADGKALYSLNNAFFSEPDSRPSCSIDSAYCVTVLPGMSLTQLLPLALLCVPVSLDTVLQLEISKRAVVRAFDAGYTPQSILAALEQVVRHELPQNLRFSLDDWYAGYTSATLFKGYVLRILPEKEMLIEKNPEFAPYIRMKLASGVFLLGFASDQEVEDVIARSRLDFLGKVHNVHGAPETVPYMHLQLPGESGAGRIFPLGTGTTSGMIGAEIGGASTTGSEESPAMPKLAVFSPEETAEFQNGLLAALEEKPLTKEQTAELTSRIRRKIVVSPTQLRGDSVRPERVEASGMDFLGKVHVIEHALQSQSMLHLTLDGTQYLVEPLALIKESGDTLLKGLVSPQNEETLFSVARTQYVKRLRGAIFKEPEY